MEKLQSIAQAMKDTINTIGKEVVGVPASVMRSINNNILKSSAARANAYKVEYEVQAKNLKDAQEKLEKTSEEYKEYWQDMVDTAEEAMNEAKENMLAQIQDYAEQAATILEESLAESFAEMGKNLYGMTLDDAQAAFDRYTTLSEDFL
jgi:polyhydroxyalkanoate synthesis regulator phasin